MDKTLQRPMLLSLMAYPTGHHLAAWRHPDTDPGASSDMAHYQRLAQTAEAAGFEIIFLPDRLAIPGGSRAALQRIDEWSQGFEALTLAGALAASTSRIGIVATASTTFNEPFTLARQLASLDLMSGGRMGWNIVTSSLGTEVLNFNPVPNFSHAARYERAGEFISAARALWNSWNPQGIVRNKHSGLFFESDALREANHQGEHFRTRGPLNVIPSSQGRPVLVQAGSSPAGRELAAHSAEVVFTAHPCVEDARAFRSDMHQRLRGVGRATDELAVLPGIFPIIGDTQAEAEARFEELQSLIQPEVAIALLETYLGDVDLSDCDPDGPLPELPTSNAIRSRQQLLTDLAARDDLTIRQLALKVAGARGHWQVVGTPESIADQMENWFTTGAADGFMLMPPTYPDGLDAFVKKVMPILRQRGLLGDPQADTTLRRRLGLRQGGRINHHATEHFESA